MNTAKKPKVIYKSVEQ